MDKAEDVALVEPMIATLESLFSAVETEKIARQSRFIERSTSRLSGRMFLMMNVLPAEGHLYTGIEWVGGKRNGTTYLGSIEKNIEPGSLYIKDLGFWDTSHFGKIHQAEAYFITRSL